MESKCSSLSFRVATAEIEGSKTKGEMQKKSSFQKR